MKAYKVVRVGLDNKKMSAYWGVGKEFDTEYKVGQFATSPFTGSKLYVFKNFNEAKHFASVRDKRNQFAYEVWECEIEGYSDNPAYLPLDAWGGLKYDFASKFWGLITSLRSKGSSIRKVNDKFIDRANSIQHTYYAADRVMLTTNVHTIPRT